MVYHLYIVFAKDRDGLLRYCIDKGIEAKIHYPVPIYRQPALQSLGHKQGDFPISDAHTKKIITFPCDQHLEQSQLDYIIETVAGYYEKYIPVFKKPELRMMMGSFANIESVHQHAYSLLLDTVGMPESEYKAFAKYEEMSAKHDYVQKLSLIHI